MFDESAARLSKDQLRALCDFRPVRTISKIVLFFGLLAASTAVAWTSDSIVVEVLAYLAAGYLWMSIVTFMHEAVHGTLFRRKWLNWAFGIVALVPLMVSFVAFREDHLVHHRFNRSPQDPDAFTMGKRGFLDFLTFYAYAAIGGVLTLVHFNVLYPVMRFNRKQWAIHLFEMVLTIGTIWATLSWASSEGILGHVLQVWLFPVLVFSLLNSMRFIAEHYETPWNQGRLAGTRTVVSNRLHSWFWNNINWHIGHHLYPRVPCYNLVKLHELIEPQIQSSGAIVDPSYIAVFVKALAKGPETHERLEAALQRRAMRSTVAANDQCDATQVDIVPAAGTA
jgi:fatty acid desaturase